MRVFFGLELDSTTAVQISDWRDRQLSCDGNAVPPSNFHITLAFAGSLEDPALERLCQSVEAWLAGTEVCGGTLDLNRLGYWDKPGIFWLGPTRWPDTLSDLSRRLRGLTTAVGAKRDRNPFQPHITLFRRCQAAPSAPTRVPAFSLAYRHFTLFESRQGKQGVSYHTLQDWDLGEPTVQVH